jgi:hypothetical protein
MKSNDGPPVFSVLRAARRLALAGVQVALPVLICLVGCVCACSGESLTIDYSAQAVPVMSTITHSGATVAEVVAELRRNPVDEGRRALVQPYLAPMSRVLVNAAVGQDPTRSWRDLQSELTASERGDAHARPAWRDLLDEGRYRVCYDADGVRLFAPGSDALAAWRNSWPLLRFPVRFLRDSGRSRCSRIELFAYDNSYAGLYVRVFRQPHTVGSRAVDSDPEGLAPLNLSALDDFMRTGTPPLAVEVDEEARLYLYGRQGQFGTLAGSGMTLADLAVAYRAVFWCDADEPYISLDENEDNRFAKVNFGGLLADTRIGQVTLDADRYFKTVSTGLDPFDRMDISDRIRSQVAGFLPGSVKDLPTAAAGSSSYRFWFYPDSLRVLTDGSIGVVASPRFLADIERRDGSTHIATGHRRSIADLNRRYEAYGKAVPTYQELDNVGRLLALMTWLRETQAGKRVDLAALLSVELPAWRTERVTPKILAVNCYSGPAGMLDEQHPGFLPRTRIFDFSDSLAQCRPTVTDDELLEFGAKFFKELPGTAYKDASALAGGQSLAAMAGQITSQKSALETLSRDIERTKVIKSNRKSIDAYNAKVKRYDAALKTFNEQVDAYNRLATQDIAVETVTHMFVSVGGGIDLSLRRAVVIHRAPSALAVREITAFRPGFVAAGKVQAVGGWIRSRP